LKKGGQEEGKGRGRDGLRNDLEFLRSAGERP
jgi:hypothetical protein